MRPCVIEKGYDNCAQCEQYICDRLKERLVVYEEVRQRSGTEISPEDYVSYIQPYENKLRLDKMKE